MSGSWSLITMMLGKPMTNIWHFSNAHAASSSIGAYLRSASVKNLLPANIRHQPSGQQFRAFSIVHWQCFCRSRKSISSLLQSQARQVTRSLSNIATLFWTRSIITRLESLNVSSRLWFQVNLGLCLVRSQKSSMTWPNEYAKANWNQNPMGITCTSSHPVCNAMLEFYRKAQSQWVSAHMRVEVRLGCSTIQKWPSPFPGQWLVAGLVSGHISVYIHQLASVMFQVLRVWYWVTARSTFCLSAEC